VELHYNVYEHTVAPNKLLAFKCHPRKLVIPSLSPAVWKLWV